MVRKILIVVFIVCTFISCAKENEESLKVITPTCDTVNRSYALHVLPIIQANCYSCHSDNNVTAGINLEGYQRLKIYATNNKLVGVITHAAGFPPMPLGRAKLVQCDIDVITAWVRRGALNN